MKELLFSITRKDFKIEWFSGTGAGGQYRNKHQNCIRIHHPESGAMVTGQSYRERPSNVKEALKNLVNNPKFKIWHSRRVTEILDKKTLDQKIEEMMRPENIKVEGHDENGRWIDMNDNNRLHSMTE